MKDLVLSSLNELDMIWDDDSKEEETAPKPQEPKKADIKEEEPKVAPVPQKEPIEKKAPPLNKIEEREALLTDTTLNENIEVQTEQIEEEKLSKSPDESNKNEYINLSDENIKARLQEVVGQTEGIRLANVSKEIEKLLNEVNENREFLLNLKERLLVLFEGLKAPKNENLDLKIDLVLNFFEYLLATIEFKLDSRSK
jgi:hypothetical protein